VSRKTECLCRDAAGPRQACVHPGQPRKRAHRQTLRRARPRRRSPASLGGGKKPCRFASLTSFFARNQQPIDIAVKILWITFTLPNVLASFARPLIPLAIWLASGGFRGIFQTFSGVLHILHNMWLAESSG